MKKARIAIIGGGYTGLVAALRLSERPQVVVTIFERSNACGGLAGDFTIQGASLEKTYHHLFRTDTDILALVDELSLTSKLRWLPSSVAIRRDGCTYPFMSPVDVLRFTPIPFFSRLRLGAVMLYLKHRRTWRPLVAQTALGWMRKACGRMACDVIWQPLLRGKFDHYHEHVSMAWLWARLHIRANSRNSAVAGEQLGYFDGGFSVLTRQLEAILRSRGVIIQTSATVETLHPRSDGIRATVNGVSDDFDAVIFTGSSRAFGRLLRASQLGGETYLSQLESIPYLGAICLVFASDQDLGDHYWTNLNEPSAPFLVFINHTKLVSREAYAGRYIYYIGAYQPEDAELFRLNDTQLCVRWFSYLKTLFPHFDERRIVEQHIFRLRDAQHVVEPDYESRRPDYRTPLAGLYLANFSQIFPEDRGTNYAVREGARIAGIVADDAKLG